MVGWGKSTYIDVGGIDVIRVRYAVNLLQNHAIVVVRNAFLVLVLFLVVAPARVLARVGLHFDRLELELVQDGEFAPLLAQLQE